MGAAGAAIGVAGGTVIRITGSTAYFSSLSLVLIRLDIN